VGLLELRHLSRAAEFRVRGWYERVGIAFDRIFQPLGMTRSGPTMAELFRTTTEPPRKNFDGSRMPHENVDGFSGAGAVVSTGADIARWMRLLLADGMFEGR
jgi:CubicO group peptidase (beta-lactamase class C family)